VQDALLSATLYLYSQGDSNEERRLSEVAKLADDLVQQWPSLLDKCQGLVNRLVEGLPNKDSRWFWQLQVKLRALT
jgi:hypothetical protein